MAETITNVVNAISSVIGYLGPFFGFFIIFLESIIPVLPLSVFIALNVVTFGSIVALIISWLGTIFGCLVAFYLSRKFSHYINKKFKHNNKINNKVKEFRKFINKISFSNLVILFAIPFTPAFPINIAAGMSNMSQKRFIMALIIGKLPMVYFWVFIGKNLTDCLTDISVLAKMIFMIVMAYLVGKVANTFIKE